MVASRTVYGIAHIVTLCLIVAAAGCGGGGASGGSGAASNTLSLPLMNTSDSRATLTSAVSRAFTPNYSTVLTPQARWGTNTLRVYVPNAADVPIAQQAMQRWEQSTGGLFRLSLTDQNGNPQITFSRAPQSSFDPNIIGRTNYTFNRDNQQLITATVRVSQDISEVHQAEVAVHEFGHALGIQGHSDQSKDIMFATVPDNVNISDRDLNTLFWIYRDGPVAASSGRAVTDIESVTLDCPAVEQP